MKRQVKHVGEHFIASGSGLRTISVPEGSQVVGVVAEHIVTLEPTDFTLYEEVRIFVAYGHMSMPATDGRWRYLGSYEEPGVYPGATAFALHVFIEEADDPSAVDTQED